MKSIDRAIELLKEPLTALTEALLSLLFGISLLKVEDLLTAVCTIKNGTFLLSRHISVFCTAIFARIGLKWGYADILIVWNTLICVFRAKCAALVV
ncbi:hypothetical protein [Paenibacillus sp. DMB5]|uniref:hypothetical protein n=1 Tax=Paenibacillus sp. DMB5 TaxID=1780103 RepID=UPI00076C8B58|nr:hypothetical protein [Paenibacillus sp. DMB5]KUP21043.1 hypothetical protein AWJ19_27375 [Paenibacillus sp. DMB5]